MNKLMNIAQRFREEEDGAAMVEYSILLGIIAAASIGAVIGIGKWAGDQFSGLCGELSGKGIGNKACSTGGTGTGGTGG